MGNDILNKVTSKLTTEPLILIMNKDFHFQIIPKDEYSNIINEVDFNRKFKSLFIDLPLIIKQVTNETKIICFTQSGNYFSIIIRELIKITNLKELLNAESNDQIIDIHIFDSETNIIENKDFVFTTKSGLVKRTKSELFLNNKSTLEAATKLGKEDLLVNVKLADNDDRVLISTKNLKTIRFDMKNIRILSKDTFGVKGITFVDDSDNVISMSINKGTNDYVLTLTEKGNVITRLIDDYRITRRGGKGVISLLNKSKTGEIIKTKIVQDDNVLQISTNNKKNILIRVSDLRVCSRRESGRKAIRLTKNEIANNIVNLPNVDSSFKDGEKYVGELKDNERNGTGTLTFINGEEYVGEFKDDKFNGSGIFTRLRGEKYIGEFKNGKYNGYGILTIRNQYKYVGEFKEGEFDGHGKLTSNYSKYVGEFKKGKKHGYGTNTTPDGPNYKGTYENDKRHGVGTIYFPGERGTTRKFKDGNFADSLRDLNYIPSKNKIIASSKFYLFFDTETTGFPKNWKAPVTDLNNWPRLVQLAYSLYDSNGNLILSNDFIIKPNGFTIPTSSSNIHGITTDRAHKEGVPITSALNQFNTHIKEANYLIAHNMSFDEKIIGSELLRNGFNDSTKNKNKICTKIESTKFCAIQGPYGYKWPKLSELHHKLFGTDFEDAHDALADVTATAKCFWELRRLGEI